MPEDAKDFYSIFKTKPTKKQMNKIKNYKSFLQNSDISDLKQYGNGDYFCRLENYLLKSNSNFVIVIGHNDRGLFYFPDGSSKALSDLTNMCKQYNKKPIILSCQAKQYSKDIPAAKRDLTYDQAFEIQRLIIAKTSNLNPDVQYSLQDLNTKIQAIIDEKQYNGKVQLITSVDVGAAIVVGTIVGSPDDAD